MCGNWVRDGAAACIRDQVVDGASVHFRDDKVWDMVATLRGDLQLCVLGIIQR